MLRSRKRCLLLNNLVAISAAILMVLSKTAMSFEMIMVGRFLYGINAGETFGLDTAFFLLEIREHSSQFIITQINLKM